MAVLSRAKSKAQYKNMAELAIGVGNDSELTNQGDRTSPQPIQTSPNTQPSVAKESGLSSFRNFQFLANEFGPVVDAGSGQNGVTHK
jgi:hypothetical protein